MNHRRGWRRRDRSVPKDEAMFYVEVGRDACKGMGYGLWNASVMGGLVTPLAASSPHFASKVSERATISQSKAFRATSSLQRISCAWWSKGGYKYWVKGWALWPDIAKSFDYLSPYSCWDGQGTSGIVPVSWLAEVILPDDGYRSMYSVCFPNFQICLMDKVSQYRRKRWKTQPKRKAKMGTIHMAQKDVHSVRDVTSSQCFFRNELTG